MARAMKRVWAGAMVAVAWVGLASPAFGYIHWGTMNSPDRWDALAALSGQTVGSTDALNVTAGVPAGRRALVLNVANYRLSCPPGASCDYVTRNGGKLAADVSANLQAGFTFVAINELVGSGTDDQVIAEAANRIGPNMSNRWGVYLSQRSGVSGPRFDAASAVVDAVFRNNGRLLPEIYPQQDAYHYSTCTYTTGSGVSCPTSNDGRDAWMARTFFTGLGHLDWLVERRQAASARRTGGGLSTSIINVIFDVQDKYLSADSESSKVWFLDRIFHVLKTRSGHPEILSNSGLYAGCAGSYLWEDPSKNAPARALSGQAGTATRDAEFAARRSYYCGTANLGPSKGTSAQAFTNYLRSPDQAEALPPLPSPPPPPPTAGKWLVNDYDGDGKTDLTVFRPSTGEWFRWLSSSGPTGGPSWGQAGDIPISGDYDGDGRTDAAVYRPSTAEFWRWYSSSGPQPAFVYGNVGDIPIPADYDGDGKTDIAVYRPSTATFYRWYSSAGDQGGLVYGNHGDIPIPADYDGDRKADIAVYRPSTAAFYRWFSSVGPQPGVVFGGHGNVPVPADYDGDRRVDIAVLDTANYLWHRLYSSNGATVSNQWGTAGDIPAPGDHDGDGLADITVYRPSTGMWWRWWSSTGPESGYSWGLSTDIPLTRPTRYLLP